MIGRMSTVRFHELAVQRRWLVAACIALPLLVAEVAEHRFIHTRIFEPDFLIETLGFGVAFPVLICVVLPNLASSRFNKLSEQLVNRRWWVMASMGLVIVARELVEHGGNSVGSLGPEQLVDTLAYGIALPLVGGALLSYYAHGPSAVIERQLFKRRWAVMAFIGSANVLVELIAHRPFSLATLSFDFVAEVLALGVVLPLVYGILLTELLRSKLDTAVASIENKATEAERRRIARELHDSLGQNLGYVHLKLDQLADNVSQMETAAVRQELEQVRQRVEEAYAQMRGGLVALQPGHVTDLAKALEDYAGLIGSRSGWALTVKSEGQPRRLSPAQRHEIFHIFREALVNVEKHAGARRVDIKLLWSLKGLTMTLADDGHGFDSASAPPDGHFGLAMMRERANAIHARLTLTSRSGAGTRIELWLPLDEANRW